MKARLLASWARVSASYWFIPTLMAVGAAVLGVALPLLDARVGDGWIGSVDGLFATKPAGARELLSMIAGSMITVAGVTFSITIASVAYAASQLGPRLLTNFMADRGNQVTLGTFTATFLYCLLVLRTIRTAGEPEPGTSAPDVVGAFVPQIAVLVALALALASIGVLIFFIHHVPRGIHASNVAASLGRGLRAGIEGLFPDWIGHDSAGASTREVSPEEVAALRRASGPVPAPKTGYVEVIDASALLAAARAHDVVVFLPLGPGVFVAEGTPMLFASPACRLTDGARAALTSAFSIGSQRTPTQDALFLADELVEIAARALSPGVNDPFTAITCMDWLGAAAVALAGRQVPGPLRFDDDGRLRVVARGMTFAAFAEHAFGALRPYAATDRNAALHLMQTYARVAPALANAEQRAVLTAHADRLHADADATLTLPDDRARLGEARRDVRALLADPAPDALVDALARLT